MPKCPNCGSELKFILEEWVCLECEYHSKTIEKEVEKSFR
jgi:Zn ribbon nucleic-acid-binding protein